MGGRWHPAKCGRCNERPRRKGQWTCRVCHLADYHYRRDQAKRGNHGLPGVVDPEPIAAPVLTAKKSDARSTIVKSGVSRATKAEVVIKLIGKHHALMSDGSVKIGKEFQELMAKEAAAAQPAIDAMLKDVRKTLAADRRRKKSGKTKPVSGRPLSGKDTAVACQHCIEDAFKRRVLETRIAVDESAGELFLRDGSHEYWKTIRRRLECRTCKARWTEQESGPCTKADYDAYQQRLKVRLAGLQDWIRRKRHSR